MVGASRRQKHEGERSDTLAEMMRQEVIDVAMRKVGLRPEQNSHRRRIPDPIGTLHKQAIQRVADVPKAADGFSNTTPGASDSVVILKKDKS
jgi:hypothetical protein